jgi:hypothetical protein
MLRDHARLKKNMLKHKKDVLLEKNVCNTKKDVCFKRLLIIHNTKKRVYLKDNKSQLKDARN